MAEVTGSRLLGQLAALRLRTLGAEPPNSGDRRLAAALTLLPAAVPSSPGEYLLP